MAIFLRFTYLELSEEEKPQVAFPLLLHLKKRTFTNGFYLSISLLLEIYSISLKHAKIKRE